MTELIRRGGIFPIENSRLLSTSPDGHVHLDISNATEMFCDWVNDTPREELNKQVRAIATGLFVIAIIGLLVTKN